MEAIVNKYFWVVRLLGIGCVLAFAASAAATQLGTSFVLIEPTGLVTSAAGLATGDPDDEDDENAIKDARTRRSVGPSRDTRSDRGHRVKKAAAEVLAYNVFCPLCVPIVETGGQDPTAPVQPGEIKSKLPLVLLATMEAEDAKDSLATLQDTETSAIGPYGVEDELRPGVTLHAVQRGRVVLKNGRQLEYIKMGDDPPPKRSTSAVTPKAKDKPKPKNSRAIAGAAEAISCSGENCVIERAFVEKILSNPALLAKQARIVPAIKDGETRGFKFYGVRSGSLPKLLGIKNGDLLTSVNGNELKSIDQALGLYTKLRRASNLSVVLERKGKTLTKEIEIK
ncbi:MAG: type II secretion system protein GspC [Nannocystaceae bacterium]